jgi:hypothetical protein
MKEFPADGVGFFAAVPHPRKRVFEPGQEAGRETPEIE